MPALAGRKVRISIGETAIAGALVDNMTINREHIDDTDKDDLGVRSLLSEIGVWSMEMTVSGRIKTTALTTWAATPTDVLKTMTFLITGIGSFTGSFGMSSHGVGGSDGAEAATFEATFVSDGAIVYTPAGA